MPLRIVIDVRRVKDFGIGTYIRNLVKALAGIDSADHYTLIAEDDFPQEFEGLPPNFETVLYGIHGWNAAEHLRFPMFLKRQAPDLVHIPLNEVPLLMPKPYVVTIHDMSSFLFGNRKGIRENVRLYNFRRGLMRADAVIAVSANTRRDVENLLGVPASRIRQVYSAPDPKFFEHNAVSQSEGEAGGDWPGERRRVLERYQIDYPFILYSGRIRPHKNVPRLVEAFAVVKGRLESHPAFKELRLIIIGDEITTHPEVRRAVIQTRMEQCVRFLGFVPFDTLKMFYASASAFIFPSLYEGFGLPPLEAMASGTPVIASKLSSLPEAVAEAAMLINPENVFDMARGIEEVLLDDNLRATLVEQGYARARQFNWRRTAEQVLEVYREVAQEATRASH
jgi:glycosyltransferase involved in cell wall biosynthesis